MKRLILIPLSLATLVMPVMTRAQSDADGHSLAATAALPQEDLVIRGDKGPAHPFHVELALNPLDQMHGLMNRTTMSPNAGMLFMFSDVQPREFWMKDTLIPLDMLFIGRDGTIGHIHANAVPNDETSIPSKGPAMAVLELNGGTAAKLGIKAGDMVFDSEYFKNIIPQ